MRGVRAVDRLRRAEDVFMINQFTRSDDNSSVYDEPVSRKALERADFSKVREGSERERMPRCCAIWRTTGGCGKGFSNWNR